MKTKQRTLAVLLVLVLVLGGLLWFVSRSNAAEEAASSAAAEGSILLSSFAAGDVTSIRYAYGGETLTLNYDSGSWTLADDPDYHLDASACNTMVTALASLNAKRQLTGSARRGLRPCRSGCYGHGDGGRRDEHLCLWHREPGHRRSVCAEGRGRCRVHRFWQQGGLL